MSSPESFCPSHMPSTSYSFLFIFLNAWLVFLRQSFQKYRSIWFIIYLIPLLVNQFLSAFHGPMYSPVPFSFVMDKQILLSWIIAPNQCCLKNSSVNFYNFNRNQVIATFSIFHGLSHCFSLNPQIFRTGEIFPLTNKLRNCLCITLLTKVHVLALFMFMVILKMTYVEINCYRDTVYTM